MIRYLCEHMRTNAGLRTESSPHQLEAMVARTGEVTSHDSFVFTNPTVSEIGAEKTMPLTHRDQCTQVSCQVHCDW